MRITSSFVSKVVMTLVVFCFAADATIARASAVNDTPHLAVSQDPVLVADIQDAQSAPARREQLFASWLPRFHETWESDSCVQQAQGWDDYVGWVHTFYYQSGGWFDTMDSIASRVTNPTAKARISKELTSLGRRVAGEWSKDNSCRRIDTFGPYGIGHFAGVLQAGLSRETGDGTSVQSAINEVQAEVNQLLKAP